jgi:putative acetyltransferase
MLIRCETAADVSAIRSTIGVAFALPERSGVGSALMHAILGAAEALEEPLVGVLGDPGYYSNFGFRPSQEYGIEPAIPRWQSHFQIRTLSAYSQLVHGTFKYPKPFDRL